MALIVASVAILFSVLSFYVARRKASKSALEEIRSRNSKLQSRLDELERQVSTIQERPTPDIPALIQPDDAPNEILTLKTELGCIRRDLQLNSHKLANQSEIIEAIRQKQSASEPSRTNPVERTQHKQSPVGEISQSVQASNPFPSIATFPGVTTEQPTHPAEGNLHIEEPSLQQSEPYEQFVLKYQDALNRGDRQTLRQMQVKELNITSESEDSLLRGSSEKATKLQAVLGGGSYMVVSGAGRYWLFPTAQTLYSFSMNQPQKGIFSYECEMLPRPAVKKPAEVREEGDHWTVIHQGIISVPG